MRNSALSAQVRGDFAESRQIWRNSPESRPFTAEPAGWRVREQPEFFRISRRHFSEVAQNHGVRNPTISDQVSGYFAEFRQIGRNFPGSRPLPQSRPDGGSANRRNFPGFREDISTQSAAESRGAELHPSSRSKWQFRGISPDRSEFSRIAPLYSRTGRVADPRTADFFLASVEIFLHNRPQSHGVRNPALSSQVSGDFAEFWQGCRNSPGSLPFAEEPAGMWIREPPRCFWAPGHISTQSAEESSGSEFRLSAPSKRRSL